MQVAIEGEDAVSATEELLSISGISGSYTAPAETEREATVATVATIIGIVGGTMAIAEQIRKWYLEYKQHKSGKKIAKVLIVGKNGERLLLEGATAEQIQQILNS
ncbi:MAG: hypothetical protein HC836_11435 [Richelia sp. RM2_1_2]|nr:hypothetical protein [Richelia sp. SM2_1_7]NJM22867.1 hypothetical protein [Richelia sp. SM1_7_0]NJN10885.1 hypothetical protein [Richelia sp. RM1_1_1]NJO29562.1 hypothetical protein [Richelia sp. SL_2_1]NJO58923.1 hypothetical protein [Richelia sp. RM2_1_2]